MFIVFQCGCGKTIKADAVNAAQTVRCPHCAALLTVPTQELGLQLSENEGKDIARPPQIEDPGYDVLESDRDLPKVKRARKRPIPPPEPEPPTWMSPEEYYEREARPFPDLYQRRRPGTPTPLMYGLGFGMLALVLVSSCVFLGIGCLTRNLLCGGLAMAILFVGACVGAVLLWLHYG
jgi:hypothetical protein